MFLLTYLDDDNVFQHRPFSTHEGAQRAAGFASFAGYTHIRIWQQL